MQLSNFTLKNQLIPIGNGVGIGLEYGSVGSLRIQVPWTRLQSGEIQVTTEDIDLVLRVHIDHEQLLKNPLLSKRHIKKMVLYFNICVD